MFRCSVFLTQGKCEMSVTDRMTSAVSKIADACEESAKTARAVQLSWKEDELPQGYLKLAD